MRVYTYSEARQNLASLLDIAQETALSEFAARMASHSSFSRNPQRLTA